MFLPAEQSLRGMCAIASLRRQPICEPAEALRNSRGQFGSDRTRTSSSSSLVEGSLKTGAHQAGNGSRGRRQYRMQESFSGGIWQKMSVLNPLLLLDMALPLLHPSTHPRIMWDVIMLIVVLYVAVVAPLKISFAQATHIVVLHILDIVATVFLSLDIIVNFRTAYISPQGELVRDSRLIASRYMRGLFLLDVAAAIPFSFIFHIYDRVTTWLALLKLVPLLRLVRLMKGSGNVGSLLAMGRLIIFMLLVAHWACCFWHYLSEAIPEWPWMFTVRCPTCSSSLQYLMGFYSAFLLLLGDKPDTHNNLERAVVAGLLFMGTLLYAVVVGSMSLLVASMFSMSSRHRQRSMMLDDALRYRGVQEEVRYQVGEYFDYLSYYQHPGTDGVAFLQELPVGLFSDVMGTMFGPRLSRVQLFAHCERPFLWRLSQRLRLSLYMPGDIIYDVGSVGHDMYIVWKGAVALMGLDGCMIALLSDGEHFGELGVMAASAPRPHRAVALKPSDVMLLSRWDLQNAMKDFPESAGLVKYRARTRLEDHEAPANNLWAFLAGWEQVLAVHAADARQVVQGGTDGGGAALKSRAVLRRRQRCQAEATTVSPTSALPTDPQEQQLQKQQQQQQQQVIQSRFIPPPSSIPSDNINKNDNDMHCNKNIDDTNNSISSNDIRRGGGDDEGTLANTHCGPVAESMVVSDSSPALDGSSTASASAATSVAAVTAARASALSSLTGTAADGAVTHARPTAAKAFRSALNSLGGKIAGLLRGGQLGNKTVAEENDATSTAACFCIHDDEDARSVIAASSGLSLRAPSSAVLQALVRQGHTLTATQRRGMLSSPVPPLPTSGSGADGLEKTGTPQDTLTYSASAWSSQDGCVPGVVRHGRSHVTPSLALAGSSAKLIRQRSRQWSTIWNEPVRVEEFSDDDTLGNESGARCLGTRRQLGEPHSPVCTVPNSSSSSKQRHIRQGGSSRIPGRMSLQVQVASAAREAFRKRSDMGYKQPSSGMQLPHQNHIQSAALAFAGDLQQQQQQQQQQQTPEVGALPTLEEVWSQIHKAANATAPGDPMAGGQHLLQTGCSSQDLHQRLQLMPPSMSSSSQLQGGVTRGRPAGSQVWSQGSVHLSGSRYGSSDGYCRRTTEGMQPLSAAASAAAPNFTNPLESQFSSYGLRQGSSGSILQKLLSQGGVEDGMEAAIPYQPATTLHTRLSLGPFANVVAHGLSSPASRSPKTSSTGLLPMALASRQSGNRITAEPGGGGASALVGQPSLPARQSSRLLTRATSIGRGRLPTYTSSRPPGSLQGFTAVSAASSGGVVAVGSGGGSSSHAAADIQLSRVGPLESDGEGGEGDDSSWSSDSSAGESRRLVASLRTQLVQANARVVMLEAQIADMSRDPLQVPAVAAVVQQEVRAVIERMGSAVDARLTELNELLAQMSVRADDLSKMIAATDERLYQLENDRGGDFHNASDAATAIALANMSMSSTGAPGSAMNSGGGSGKLHQSPGTLDALMLTRHSSSGIPASGGLSPLHLKGADSMTRTAQHLKDFEGVPRDWHRNMLNAGPMAGGNGAFYNSCRRAAGARSSHLTQPPIQGILKNGLSALASARATVGEVIEQEPTEFGFSWCSLATLGTPERLRPDLPGILAAATAATADNEVSVRRGRSFPLP